MNAMRSLAAALLLASTLGPGCYSERIPPPNFRYACEGDGDCNANEICRRGLCERPCTQVTVADDCPQEDGFLGLCFNGVCANTCDLAADYCPAAYECIDFGIDLPSGGSPFGGSDAELGICGLRCDADDNADLCPEGEICIAELGTCATDCSQGQSCPSGYTCFFGVCAPEGTEIPSGDGSSGGAGLEPEDDATGGQR